MTFTPVPGPVFSPRTREQSGAALVLSAAVSSTFGKLPPTVQPSCISPSLGFSSSCQLSHVIRALYRRQFKAHFLYSTSLIQCSRKSESTTWPNIQSRPPGTSTNVPDFYSRLASCFHVSLQIQICEHFKMLLISHYFVIRSCTYFIFKSTCVSRSACALQNCQLPLFFTLCIFKIWVTAANSQASGITERCLMERNLITTVSCLS